MTYGMTTLGPSGSQRKFELGGLRKLAIHCNHRPRRYLHRIRVRWIPRTINDRKLHTAIKRVMFRLRYGMCQVWRLVVRVGSVCDISYCQKALLFVSNTLVKHLRRCIQTESRYMWSIVGPRYNQYYVFN